jgi:hypothetical protein
VNLQLLFVVSLQASSTPCGMRDRICCRNLVMISLHEQVSLNLNASIMSLEANAQDHNLAQQLSETVFELKMIFV